MDYTTRIWKGILRGRRPSETIRNKSSQAEQAIQNYNFDLKTLYHKNNVSIWDGIIMGYGVGTAIYHKYRIATDKTIFAMPE